MKRRLRKAHAAFSLKVWLGLHKEHEAENINFLPNAVLKFFQQFQTFACWIQIVFTNQTELGSNQNLCLLPGLGHGVVQEVVGEQLGGAGGGCRIGVHHEPQQDVQLTQ
jgi:hypothetical protein